jgi:hypothetical protein
VSFRVLLDENMAHKLRRGLAAFDTATVQYIGFGGLKNGELLSAAEAAGFAVFVTGDKTLEYEQDMKGRNIAVVALSATHWPIVRNHVMRIAGLFCVRIGHRARRRGSACGQHLMVDASGFCGTIKLKGLMPVWDPGPLKLATVRLKPLDLS